MYSAFQHIAMILLLGYVAYGLSIYFYTYAQRTIGAAKTSTYYALAPFIGALLSISPPAPLFCKKMCTFATTKTRYMEFRDMRRKPQQPSEEESIGILQKATSGTLALLGDEGYPYAVPISYIYDDGKLYWL